MRAFIFSGRASWKKGKRKGESTIGVRETTTLSRNLNVNKENHKEKRAKKEENLIA
jgi:hypothetical protein